MSTFSKATPLGLFRVTIEAFSPEEPFIDVKAIASEIDACKALLREAIGVQDKIGAGLVDLVTGRATDREIH